MISHEVTQRNIWPYLIGLGLIMLALLVGWMANQALQAAGLQMNIGSAPVVDPSTEIHAADRKFFFNSYPAAGSGSDATMHPADRKFLTNSYTAAGSAPVVDRSAENDAADRKFFTQ